MSRVEMRRPLSIVAVMTLLALALVGVAAPAQAASTMAYASGWSVNNNADWTPFPPSANPLGAPDPNCTGASTPTGSWAEFSFPGLGIPGGDTIDGIEVRFNYRTSATNTAQLLKSGSLVGSTRSVPSFLVGPTACSSTGWVTSGGASDLWGTTWTAADFNTAAVEVRLTQNANTIDLDAVELIVHHSGSNVPPTVAADNASVTVNEGSTANNAGTFSDPDGDPVTITASVGSVSQGAGTWSWSFPTTDGPDESQTVTITADDGTVTSSTTFALTVNNVAPSVAADNATVTVNEGDVAANTGTFSDPGADTVTVSASVGTVVQGAGTWSWSWLTTDGPADSQTVTVTATDSDGASSQTTFGLTVNNVAPTLSGLSASAISENGSTTLSGSISDPGTLDDFMMSINWGDPLSPGNVQVVNLAAGTTNFSVGHQYLDDNPSGTAADNYTIGITVTDKDGGSDSDSTTVNVANLAPTIDTIAITSPIDEDDTATLSGTYSDTGMLDTHTLDIDWDGDATFDETVIVSSGTFSVPHQYLDDDPTGTPSDTYAVNARLTDDDTGSDTDSASLTVNNVDPVITSIASDATFADKAEEGEIVTVSGAFTDVGTLDTHIASVDWGDGNVTPATVTQGSGSGTYTAGHAYVAGGVFIVTVTVIDDDTGTTSDTTLAVVSGVGINGGVLQVVGTSGDDHVDVIVVNDEVDVFASFVNPKHRRFDLSAVISVELWLCEGDDHGDVHQSIVVDATIHGGDDDDMLWGGSANDFIEGGDGNDKLWGRDGDDVLHGDAGNDKLWGGSGTNILVP